MLAVAAPAPTEARDLLRRLVRLVPHESLGELVLEMVEGALAAPPAAPPSAHVPNPVAANGNGSKRGKRARARSGRPPGRPRKRPLGQSAEANGAATLTATAGEHAAPDGRKEAAAAFWQAAAKLDPITPWKPAADRLGLNRSVCQDAHRLHTLPPLPPGLSPEQAAAAFA